MQPADFTRRRLDDWAQWVLDNELPDLPARIEIGEAIPIACWAGPEVGAVTFVIRYSSTAADEEIAVDEDIHCYRRSARGWEPANGDGGTEWSHGADLRPVSIADGQVRWSGYLGVGGGDWACRAVDGVVGQDAAWIEIVGHDSTTRRPVNAPLGVFVTCVPAGEDATITILDQSGQQMAQHVL